MLHYIVIRSYGQKVCGILIEIKKRAGFNFPPSFEIAGSVSKNYLPRVFFRSVSIQRRDHRICCCQKIYSFE